MYVYGRETRLYETDCRAGVELRGGEPAYPAHGLEGKERGRGNDCHKVTNEEFQVPKLPASY